MKVKVWEELPEDSFAMNYDKEIKELEQAIRVSKRCTGKPPRVLIRRLSVLEHMREWTKKEKLAQTKLKTYRRKLRAYKAWDTIKRRSAGT
jgi:hypothetical protein